MKYCDIILLSSCALSLAGAQFVPPVPKPGETCMLWQECKGRNWLLNPMSKYPCRSDGAAPTSGDILNPVIEYFKPAALFKEEQKKQLRAACPMFDPDTPLCCNDDQAEILSKFIPGISSHLLAANFIQIDTVFGLDCPLCAINLKRMWCEYTCNPNKANFGNISMTSYITMHAL